MLDVGWLEKAELKPTQPSLAGAWPSLAKINQKKFSTIQLLENEQVFFLAAYLAYLQYFSMVLMASKSSQLSKSKHNHN